MRDRSKTKKPARVRRSLGAAAVALLVVAATAGRADAQRDGRSITAPLETWQLSASVGGFVPRSAVIVAADGRNTQLGAGPSFSLDLRYLAAGFASVYANGSAAFSSVALGAEIRPGVTGPSDQVTVLGLTGGVLLSALDGMPVQPTLRIGGGLKGYLFDLQDADNQWRPTGDLGVGFRGLGAGPLEVGAELRYLPSSFDQGRLPTRGIAPQAQRQTDLIFSIGVGVRM